MPPGDDGGSGDTDNRSPGSPPQPPTELRGERFGVSGAGDRSSCAAHVIS